MTEPTVSTSKRVTSPPLIRVRALNKPSGCLDARQGEKMRDAVLVSQEAFDVLQRRF